MLARVVAIATGVQQVTDWCVWFAQGRDLFFYMCFVQACLVSDDVKVQWSMFNATGSYIPGSMSVLDKWMVGPHFTVPENFMARTMANVAGSIIAGG
jgi:hypothetical protein